MPFAPVVAIDLSTPAPKAVPAITASVTHDAAESAISALNVEFPKAFGYNESFRADRCQPEQEEARACPAGSRIGTVSADSPLGAASGSVYVTDDFRIVAFASAAGGLINLKVDGSISIAPSGGFAVGFTGLPDLPISGVRLALDAGDKGLLKNPARCGAYTLPTIFTAHDGSTSQATPAVAINGCAPPRISALKTDVAGRSAMLRWTATDATDATRVQLKRGGKTVATRRVTGTSTAFTKLAAGRYRATLTALPGGNTLTRSLGRVRRGSPARGG